MPKPGVQEATSVGIPLKANVFATLQPRALSALCTDNPINGLGLRGGLDVVRYDAKSLHREFGVRFRLLGHSKGTASQTVRYNPTVSLMFLQSGMKEIPESTYEDCFKKFLCARAAGRVALRRRTQGSARLIIKLDIPSRNFRRTCSASVGSAASPKALFIKRIHRSRAA
jgi:hypothetical protein